MTNPTEDKCLAQRAPWTSIDVGSTSETGSPGETEALGNDPLTPGFLHTLIETIPNPIFYKNRAEIYIGCNRAFEEFTGLARTEIIGRSVVDMGPGEIVEEYRRMDDDLFDNPGTQSYEWRVRRTDGDERDVIFNKATFTDEAGNIAGIVGVILDITERRKMEREIINISGREQQHFGRTLHDTLGQILTGIAFQAKALSHCLQRHSPPDAVEQAEKIAKLANDALSQSRRIAHGLSPVDMMEEGLTVALNQLAEGMGELYNLQCEFTSTRPAPVYDNDTATHLYYIAREAVNNALRHGKATNIRIQLEVEGESGTLRIENNGRCMQTPPERKGMGLCIMRYRAEVIQGTLQISTPTTMPGGVAVVCRFPNPRPE